MEKGFLALIYTFGIAFIAVLALAFISLINDDSTKAITRVCDGRGACRTISVEFHNMSSIPTDSLNAAAERIIHEVSK